MYDTILVPTDGSAPADAAADVAIALAEQFDAAVHAVYAVERGGLTVDDEAVVADMEQRGREATSAIADRVEEAGLAATTAVADAPESVHSALLEYADEHDVDLIAMGTHGRTNLNRLLLGSVAERTVRFGPLPVLTVPEAYEVGDGLDPILVPTDGSDGANAGATHAVDLGSATDAELHVVHAVDHAALGTSGDAAVALDALEQRGQETVDAVVERAREAGVQSIDPSLLTGDPSSAITNYVDERDAGLVVMGTHGRTGLDRYVLGSVTEKVVRTSAVPVLTVPTPDTDAA